MNGTLLLLGALAVRNPFWPVGYDGTPEAISAEPKIEIAEPDSTDDASAANAAQAAEARARTLNAAGETRERHWQEAKKMLHPSGSTTIRMPDGTVRQGFLINGRTYGVGDRISITHEGRRFTWLVLGRNRNGTLQLQHLKARILPTTPKEGE